MGEEFHLSIKNHQRKIVDVRSVFKNLSPKEKQTLEIEKLKAEQAKVDKESSGRYVPLQPMYQANCFQNLSKNASSPVLSVRKQRAYFSNNPNIEQNYEPSGRIGSTGFKTKFKNLFSNDYGQQANFCQRKRPIFKFCTNPCDKGESVTRKNSCCQFQPNFIFMAYKSDKREDKGYFPGNKIPNFRLCKNK